MLSICTFPCLANSMSLPIPLDISIDGLASDFWMTQDGKVSLNACMKEFPLNYFVLIFATILNMCSSKTYFWLWFFATDSFCDFTMQQSLVLMMNHCFLVFFAFQKCRHFRQSMDHCCQTVDIVVTIFCTMNCHALFFSRGGIMGRFSRSVLI